MPKIVTVQGATATDEQNRHDALEQLNSLDTIVLERLSKLSKNPKAINHFKNTLQFAVLERLIK